MIYAPLKTIVLLMTILWCDKKSQFGLLERAILSIWNNPTVFCGKSNLAVGKHTGQHMKSDSLISDGL